MNIKPILIVTSLIAIFNTSKASMEIAQIPLSVCLSDTAFRSFTSLVADPAGRAVYQAKFRTTTGDFATSPDWSGKLLAYKVTSGSLASSSLWEAGSLLANNKDRKLYTLHDEIAGLCYDPPCDASQVITEFDWQYLSDLQQNLIDPSTGIDTTSTSGQEIMNYFRGSTAKESPNGIYRARTSLLGDIVNSDPVFVGSEDYGYYNLPGNEGSKYQSFMNSKIPIDNTDPRPRMIYVGSNEGMLHGFEAGTWNGDSTKPKTFDYGTGTEIFAFIPGIVINFNMHERAYIRQDSYNHSYLVDGSPRVGDAYFSSAWHTILLGATGASPPSDQNLTGPQDKDNHLGDATGGRGIYALDITDPREFNDITSGKSKVLWELNNYTAANGDADLGMTMAQPTLARMQNGKWAAIVSNGYNSPNQKPVLYILDISLKPGDSGFIMRKFSPCTSVADGGEGGSSYCPTGMDNGLSTPIAVDVNNDRRVDYIYAGDLVGNLWKFDVNCPSPSQSTGDDASCKPKDSWKVANGVKPLFVACTNSGTSCDKQNRQPITGKPQVGSVSATQGNAMYTTSSTKPSVMVYFGTGKYLELSDRSVDSKQKQTFYALWDKNTGNATDDNSISNRNLLKEQTIITHYKITRTAKGTDYVDNLRVTSNESPCYELTKDCKAQQLGWYMELTTPNNSPSERVISFPLLISGNILFTTLIPSPTPCDKDTGPFSWIMELDAITGSRLGSSPFDVYGAGGSATPDNKININDMVYLSVSENKSEQVAPTGLKSTVGVVKTPAVVPNKDVVDKFFGGSTGEIQKVTDPGSPLGRVSWRQLR